MDISAFLKQQQGKKYALLSVKIIPKSSKNEVVGTIPNGSLKIKIQAVPEKGKANKMLISFLSESLKIPQRNISIIQGETSHYKLLKIML